MVSVLLLRIRVAVQRVWVFRKSESNEINFLISNKVKSLASCHSKYFYHEAGIEL
ncbi:MAG: hypothetical protein RI953_2714 [Pseudomonadota bacterium]|jgi:hypothetical protein